MSRYYTQITITDRRRLHQLVAAKVPVNEMACQLGRHRSTIYREIKRITFHDRGLPDYDIVIPSEESRLVDRARLHPSVRVFVF